MGSTGKQFTFRGHPLTGDLDSEPDSTLFAEIAKKGVWTPSDCHASSQAGSSRQIRVRSWMHPRDGRLRVNGYVCGKLPPFPNLSRNLSLCGGFLPHPCQRRSMAQRDNRRTICTSPRHGPRAVVRCRRVPAGARPSKCIIIIISQTAKFQLPSESSSSCRASSRDNNKRTGVAR
jgi:hypothetical protein